MSSPATRVGSRPEAPVRAAVFDLDGTLVLSEERNRAVWEAFFRANGVEPDGELLHYVTGRRGADSLAQIVHMFPGRTVAGLGADLVQQQASIELPAPQPVPGAAELVRSLAAAGLPLGLVTSADRPTVEEALAELGVREHFQSVIAAEDVQQGKPDPSGYLTACEQLSVAPSEAVGFEDSPVGMEALQAARMRCIGVATTYPAATLAAADLVVTDLTEVRWDV